MGEKLLIKDFIYRLSIILNENKESHFHEDIELLYIIDGSISLKIENENFNLKKEDIVVVNSNKNHEIKIKENAVIATFHFSFNHIKEFLKENLVLFCCNSSVNGDKSFIKLREIVQEILNTYVNESGEENLLQYSLIYKLLSILSHNFLINNNKVFFNTEDKYRERIYEIESYIKSNYSKSISLNDLAKQLYLSTAYLSRFFKKQIGMNFVEYVNEIRLRYVIDDLLNTNKSITRVALDNGFSNSATFNKIFKEKYNICPSDYRKNMKENNIIKENIDSKISKKIKIKEILKPYLDDNLTKEDSIVTMKDEYISLDASRKLELKKHWNKLINIGKASDILKSEIQQHILILKDELKFEYIRFWSIFDEDMGIDINNKNGNYNFDRVDRVLDFLINNNIKPFIEVSNKGKRILKNVNEEIVNNKNISRFKSLNEWKNIIHEFTIHIVNRYGVKEVEKWYIELMKAEEFSDVGDYWSAEEYINIFNITYITIKKYVSNIKIGGAGLNIDYSKKSFKEILKIWVNNKIKPDFISVYFYPYIKDEKFFRISTDKDFVLNKIDELREIIKLFLGEKEIIISEWNCTVSNRNYINDSCYKGAYIVKNLIDSINKINGIGYWIGTDLFCEYYDTSSFLNGGAGIITKYGLKKPSFYSFDFMNCLGENIIGIGENYVVTSKDNGYQIVCHNYKHPSYYYYLKNEGYVKLDEQYKIFEDNNIIKLNFHIKNINKGKYSIKKSSINRKNGSVLDEWMKLDCCEDINIDEINYLKDICKPKMSIRRYNVTAGVLDLEVTLHPHEISRIEIRYMM